MTMTEPTLPKISVLVVDDSQVARMQLVHILGGAPGIEVIGVAASGREALAFLKHRKPDVITMDLVMPDMDGFEATRRIMETSPVPIIVVTGSYSRGDVGKSFKAMEAGAVAILGKPGGGGAAAQAAELVRTVRLMAEVKVVRRMQASSSAATHRPAAVPPPSSAGAAASPPELVVIGASTGGPPVAEYLFSRLPPAFPVPVLLVQHMSRGFIQGFVDWLNHTSGPQVRLAEDGMTALPGTVTVAPDGCQMEVAAGGRIVLVREADPPPGAFSPSVARLFRSAAAVYGRRAAGVLLTGMGRDGAAELKLLHDAGALTIVQDEASSVIFGMPGEAVRLGAAAHVAAPAEIVELLLANVGCGRPSSGSVPAQRV